MNIGETGNYFALTPRLSCLDFKERHAVEVVTTAKPVRLEAKHFGLFTLSYLETSSFFAVCKENYFGINQKRLFFRHFGRIAHY